MIADVIQSITRYKLVIIEKTTVTIQGTLIIIILNYLESSRMIHTKSKLWVVGWVVG